MSAGKFTIDGKYQTNDGEVYQCRYQPETAQAVIDSEANAAPAGAPSSEMTLRLTTGSRQFGLVPRKVKVLFTGTKPAGYDGDTAIIVALTPFWWNLATKGATGTYLGAPIKVLKRFEEKVN